MSSKINKLNRVMCCLDRVTIQHLIVLAMWRNTAMTKQNFKTVKWSFLKIDESWCKNQIWNAICYYESSQKLKIIHKFFTIQWSNRMLGRIVKKILTLILRMKSIWAVSP